jgi:hypothetical protein
MVDSRLEVRMVGIVVILLAESRSLYTERLFVVPEMGM